MPDFRDPAFLRDHIRQTIGFYHPRAIDPAGGFIQGWRDDGSVADARTRHLVGSCRFVFTYAVAALLFGDPAWREGAAHGLRFLEEAHRDRAHDGWFWVLDGRSPRDPTKHAYGHAFVLLAYSIAHEAGVPGARAGIDAAWDVLERRFWLPDHGVYADEATADWSVVSPYRGQNANMHMTEAMLAAFEATGEGRFIDRAAILAQRVCLDLAGRAGGLVWEHYDTSWQPDWDYNRDDPKNLFRPWGYQPGHQTEWAKLLLGLDRHAPQDWHLPTARRLYEAALQKASDIEWGGLHYGFAPDGAVTDTDKYHWVMAETFAASAGLAVRTGERRFWQEYDALWGWSWRHLVDRERGGWYRLTRRDGSRYDDYKSPPAKADYHVIGACREVLRWLGAA